MKRIQLILSSLLLFGVSPPWSKAADTALVEERELLARVFSLAANYTAAFQHPETGVLYGARLNGSRGWTSPAAVLREQPHPWGYGSRIADTALHTGHLLVACLDAHAARPDPRLRAQIGKLFAALKHIGSLPERFPKPGKPALVGLVPRGPHPDDSAAYYDDSSMDQHTTYIISLAAYAVSGLATEEEKKWIRDSLGQVGRRLEGNGWSIKRADGVTQAHVGFSWKGFNSGHASILLPAVLALYRGTGDEHWREAYDLFLREGEGKRWESVHPGPHVRINGHPIYANQNAFRVNAWYQFETNADRRPVIRGLLKQSAEMQLRRDFPGEFYRKYHKEETWRELGRKFAWSDTELRGAAIAWERFRPELLAGEHQGLAALAHVRFPLGGFHMALLSEDPGLIRTHLPAIWKMLNIVDLQQIDAGETHYLFTVVALHLYAHYFRSPELFARAEPEAAHPYGRPLAIARDAGTGPVMDVAVEDDHAYAIGRGSLHVLELGNSAQPRIVGRLTGLGGVRQIAVREPVAYVTSRQDGLHVIDVSDATRPRRLAHYDTVEFATGVALAGDILFVACRNYGVELIDIADPKTPAHISTVRTGEAQSVVVRNQFLYVGVWASSEVVVVDVADPRRPKVTSRVPLDGYGDGVEVRNGHLYVTTGHHSRATPRRKPGDPGFGHGHGLEIFDLQDPACPQFVSRIKFPPLYEIGNDMWSVTVAGRHAFVADTYNGAFVVDVSDPAAPKLVARCQLPAVDGRERRGFVGGLAVVKDHLYLAGGYTDLHVVPALGLAIPPVAKADTYPRLGPAESPPGEPGPGRRYLTAGQVHAVAVLPDGRVLAACGSAGVHTLRIEPEIERLAVFKTEGIATDVSVSGNRVYVAEGLGGLSVCTIAENGHELRQLARHRIKGRAVRQVEAPPTGDHVLIQSGANHFGILDVADPAAIKTLLDESRHGLLYGDQMMRGLVEDRFACVFWHVSGLHWYDLKARPAPKFSGDNYAERTGSANGLTVFRGQTLATVRGGYLLLDRDEQRPAEELMIRLPGSRRLHLGVPTVAGDRLYTANRSSGTITIADLKNPAAPKLIRQFDTPGNPCRIAVTDDFLLIPDGYNGLLVVDR